MFEMPSDIVATIEALIELQDRGVVLPSARNQFGRIGTDGARLETSERRP
jgi:hypothetical protein